MNAAIGHNGGPPLDMLAAGAPMPASIGRAADLYHDVRELRLLMAKEVERMQEREIEVREYIIANLSKSADTGAAGLKYRAQIVSKTVVRVSEEAGGWGAFFSWVRKNDRFDMLQKRLSDKAVADWIEENKRLLPGTESMTVPDVSITKI